MDFSTWEIWQWAIFAVVMICIGAFAILVGLTSGCHSGRYGFYDCEALYRKSEARIINDRIHYWNSIPKNGPVRNDYKYMQRLQK